MSQVRWVWKPQAECKDDEVPLLPVAIHEGGFPNRAKQIWRPLLAVAEFAGPEWLGKALEAARALGVDHQAASPTVLLDIYETTLTADASVSDRIRSSVFRTTVGDAIPSDDLRRALVGMGDFRWTKAENRRELSAKRLSQLLSPFGIRPRKRAVLGDSKANHRSYLVHELVEILARYGLTEVHIPGEVSDAVEPRHSKGFRSISKR